MNKKVNNCWKTGLHWTAPGLILLLMLAGIILLLLDTKGHVSIYELLAVVIPPILLAALLWFKPLAGGIVALVLVPLLYLLALGITDYGNIGFIWIPIGVVATSGAFSISYYCVAKNTKSTVKS